MEFSKVFRRVSEVLDAAAIPYMLTGSFASAYYGALRSTQDVDIVINASRPQVVDLIRRLHSADYYADEKTAINAEHAHSMFNAIDNRTGWKIDFIFRKLNPYAQEAFQRRRKVEFQQTEMFVASPEDVIVSKLEWARIGQSDRQIEDASSVLQKQLKFLDRVYVENWVAELDVNAEWVRALRLSGLE